MPKERTQYAITPRMKEDIASFWKKYKKKHNISDSLYVILINGRMTLQQLVRSLRG